MATQHSQSAARMMLAPAVILLLGWMLVPLTMTLFPLNFSVVEAENGRDALDQLRESRPAVVLTDLYMPEIDGLELVKIVGSEFPSTRSFGSTNLTYLAALGNWKLSGALGYTATRREQDAYLEVGPLGTAVASSKQTVKQTSLFGEAAYGRGASETYFGLLYEDTRDPQTVQFATGAQPANDPDSVLLNAGWRYFGRGLTANFAFVKRLAQEQVNEYGFSMMLRVDL